MTVKGGEEQVVSKRSCSMSTEIPFDPTHPANTEILRCCKSGGYENTPRDFSPKAEWLDELGSHLPDDCRGNAYGNAVLVRPSTGIIFALAGNTLALRLPEKTREVALA